MKKFDWKSMVISILLIEIGGALSALLAGNIPGKYLALEKPPLSPPGWVFGIAWGILYAMMGIAIYLIFLSGPAKSTAKARGLFYFQLAVNFSWSIIFFRFEQFWASVAVIILLGILIILTIWEFSKHCKQAAYLMIPYLLWVVFATYLNIGIAVLN